MSALKKSFYIKGRDFTHAGKASITVQQMLKQLGIATDIVRRAAVCGYEGEMNVVMHGGDGSFCIAIASDWILLEISDNGPGIADIGQAMEKGFSTALDEYREMGFGAGMGLSNIERNADYMEIESTPGKGTRVEMLFQIPEA
ncbi:MAG: ATP-binding protein [Desulfosalsimonadaceae bacterium]